ncbi:hypothetical protein JW710_00740 [Candidatus Dojkabacteria bacterium]|nr:hypothetical protein [Candidatus Dojkabacteria bacterium]
MIDLKKYSGLALAFDGSKLLPQENGIEIGSRDVVNIGDVRPQLLNPELTCPTVFYYIFSNIDRKSLLKRKRLRFDMYVIPPNLAGIEYVKTLGTSAGKYPLLLEVVHGYLTLLLQTSNEEPGSIPQVKTTTIRLKKGEKLVIPPNHDFVFVNSRQTLSVVAIMYSSKCRMKNIFDDTRGAASYVIRKNARLETVLNPSFRNVSIVKPWKPESIYKDFNLTAKTPIFKQILRKYQRFKWLHDNSKIEWTNLPGCY